MGLGEGEEAFPLVEGEEVEGGVEVKEAAVAEEVGVVLAEGVEEEGREVEEVAGEAVAVVLVVEEEAENHLLGISGLFYCIDYNDHTIL